MSRRRVSRWVKVVAVVGLAALWLVALRPASLGGPATYVIVAGQSMLPALQGGDLVFAMRSERYRPGDVVAFRVPDGEPGGGTMIIHRIVGGSAAGYMLQGDNRQFRDPWTPRADEIQGRQLFAVPRVGYALAILRGPLGLALLAGLIAFALASGRAAASTVARWRSGLATCWPPARRSAAASTARPSSARRPSGPVSSSRRSSSRRPARSSRAAS